jgi:pimeloyl-ACP methyl ester carboxylesterase
MRPPLTRSGWLLVRGLGREQRHWGSFPEMLGAALSAPVVCIDLPGFGTEHRRRSPANVQQITDDVRRRFGRTRGEGRWSILGISLGGMVALDWCARFPSDFERCVTVNTSTNLSPRRHRLRAGALRVLPATLLGSSLARERAVLRISSSAPAADREPVARRYARWVAERPPSPSSVVWQLVAAATFDVPGRVEPPLLVLGSKGDRMVYWQCSEAIARALGAPLRLHDRAGHDLPLDDPEWAREQIVRWLDAPAPRRTG